MDLQSAIAAHAEAKAAHLEARAKSEGEVAHLWDAVNRLRAHAVKAQGESMAKHCVKETGMALEAASSELQRQSRLLVEAAWAEGRAMPNHPTEAHDDPSTLKELLARLKEA